MDRLCVWVQSDQVENDAVEEEDIAADQCQRRPAGTVQNPPSVPAHVRHILAVSSRMLESLRTCFSSCQFPNVRIGADRSRWACKGCVCGVAPWV